MRRQLCARARDNLIGFAEQPLRRLG